MWWILRDRAVLVMTSLVFLTLAVSARCRMSARPPVMMARPAARQPLGLYDTTLRDGAQAEGVRFSVHDKIALASALADFGMEWIEAGWPGAIPTDDEFFAAAPSRLSPDARRRLVAFGRTVKHGVDPADDSLMQALLGCGAPSVCIVAKASESQVVRSLRLLPSHNLDMIATSVRHLKAGGVDSVFVDAEHFFDGYKACPAYSMAVVRRAMEAGADGVVLCDTNGGSMPWEVEAACRAVSDELFGAGNGAGGAAAGIDGASRAPRLGVHCHDDCGLAVANTLAAVRGGATMLQGTLNGIGERCGNANLATLAATLTLKARSTWERRGDGGKGRARMRKSA